MSTGERFAMGAFRAPAQDDGRDFFPTPPWATRAILREMSRYALMHRDMRVLDPCAGQGHMTRVLGEVFGEVHALDIERYPAPVWPGLIHQADFLTIPFEAVVPGGRVDWTVMNPPFTGLLPFIQKALSVSTVGVAALMRMQALEGRKRYEDLWTKLVPTFVCPFVERVPMHKGRLDPKGSTATAYVWVVWAPTLGLKGTRLRWIPPCRAELERPGDYAEA